eukprot:COSAG04_NODE_881_length_9663_cov_30.524258_10_plen_108_part_00
MRAPPLRPITPHPQALPPPAVPEAEAAGGGRREVTIAQETAGDLDVTVHISQDKPVSDLRAEIARKGGAPLPFRRAAHDKLTGAGLPRRLVGLPSPRVGRRPAARRG